MEFKETKYPFWYDECIKKFGNEKGKKIANMADKKLLELKKEANYRNSKAIKEHMDTKILPTIAMYSAFKESGFNMEEAYNNTLEITQISAREAKKENETLGKIPFGYQIFKLFCKSTMLSGNNMIKKKYILI